MRNPRCLCLFVQLVQQTKFRRGMRCVSGRVKFFERDRHAAAVRVRNGNLRYATPVRSRTLSTSRKGIVSRSTSIAAALQRGFRRCSALRFIDRATLDRSHPANGCGAERERSARTGRQRSIRSCAEYVSLAASAGRAIRPVARIPAPQSSGRGVSTAPPLSGLSESCPDPTSHR